MDRFLHLSSTASVFAARAALLASTALSASAILTACIPKASSAPEQSAAAAALAADPAAPPPTAKHVNRRTGPAPAQDKSLAAHFSKQFSIGVALEPRYLQDWSELLPSTFNRITAENAMKCRPIHPTQDRYSFGPADELANFARQHRMSMTGHALVWHRETPNWLVQGKPEEIAHKLQAHISQVVERYADVTDNWDVVNEAISDQDAQVYRDAAEDSSLYGAVGKSYIADAFRFAEAAVKSSGRPIELYYNDYNMAQPIKRKKAILLAKELRAQGLRIDGIGAQGHWNLTYPSPSEIQQMITDIVEAGFKLKISELDISVYPEDDWNTHTWQAERPYDDALAQQLAQRYREIFEIFVKNAEHITSVTFWGLSDDRTWLDSFPAGNRNNYPLLFDDLDRPKPAYFALFDVATGHP